MNEQKSNIHYIHFLSQHAREQLVGAFFIIALLIIASLVIAKINATKMFDDTINYHAYMKNAQGISRETLVNVSGIEVGKVSTIDITADNKIHIGFFIYKSFQKLIRTDSKGELSKLSLVSNAVIIISAGTPDRPLLPAGSELAIEEPITTDDLIEGIKPVINDLESTMSNLARIIAVINPQVIQESSQSLSKILQNIEHITQHIASGQGLLGKAIYDPQQAQNITDALNTFTATLSKIEQRVNETGPLIEDLNQLSTASRGLVADVRRSLAKVDQQLTNLPELVNDTRTLIRSTDETVQGIQQVWPLSTTIPQPSKELLLQEEALHD